MTWDGLEYIRHLYTSKKRRGPKYKFGEQVPKSIEEAYRLDKENGTTGWTDAIQLEIDLLMNKYQCFEILEEGKQAPQDYQFIKLLWVFDVKYDG